MGRHESLSSGTLNQLMDAARSGDLQTVKSIAESGFDVDQSDRFGVTALNDAAREGQVDVVRYLVDEAGADIHAGRLGSPLHQAVSEGRYAVAVFLLDRGASMDLGEENATPYDYARRRRGREDFLDLFISRMDDERKKLEFFKAAQPVQTMPRADREDWLRAGRQSYLAVIEAFIRDKSFDINAKKEGSTALHLLAEWEEGADFVRALLSAGADASLCDRIGQTAEDIALAAGNTKIVQIFLEARVGESLAIVKKGAPANLKAPKRASFNKPRP